MRYYAILAHWNIANWLFVSSVRQYFQHRIYLIELIFTNSYGVYSLVILRCVDRFFFHGSLVCNKYCFFVCKTLQIILFVSLWTVKPKTESESAVLSASRRRGNNHKMKAEPILIQIYRFHFSQNRNPSDHMTLLFFCWLIESYIIRDNETLAPLNPKKYEFI